MNNIFQVKKMSPAAARVWTKAKEPCGISSDCRSLPTHLVYYWFRSSNRRQTYRRNSFYLACDEHALAIAAEHELEIEEGVLS